MLFYSSSVNRVNVKAGVGSPPAMTSGSGNNAPTVTGSTPQNGESKPPPKAIVKPQILTHVIEGFVIQEGAEPFPVSAYPICVFVSLFLMNIYCGLLLCSN